MRILVFSLPAALLTLLACAPAEAGAGRTFVSGAGNDANVATSCAITAPCRSFNAALSVTNLNGQVVALDSAGYGPAPVNITQGVSIIAAPGAIAAISVGPGAHGIVVNAPGMNVNLRGLAINGQGGLGGIVTVSVSSLTIDSCDINNFPTGGGIEGAGIYIGAVASPAITNVAISDTTLTNNYYGVWADTGASVVVLRSKAEGNVYAGYYASQTAIGNVTMTLIDSIAEFNSYGVVAFSPFTGSSAVVDATGVSSVNNNYGFTALGGGTLSVSGSTASGNRQAGFFNPPGAATFYSGGNNKVIGNLTNISGAITQLPAMVTN
jgi:hypothetical protein